MGEAISVSVKCLPNFGIEKHLESQSMPDRREGYRVDPFQAMQNVCEEWKASPRPVLECLPM